MNNPEIHSDNEAIKDLVSNFDVANRNPTVEKISELSDDAILDLLTKLESEIEKQKIDSNDKESGGSSTLDIVYQVILHTLLSNKENGLLLGFAVDACGLQKIGIPDYSFRKGYIEISINGKEKRIYVEGISIKKLKQIKESLNSDKQQAKEVAEALKILNNGISDILKLKSEIIDGEFDSSNPGISELINLIKQESNGLQVELAKKKHSFPNKEK